MPDAPSAIANHGDSTMSPATLSTAFFTAPMQLRILFTMPLMTPTILGATDIASGISHSGHTSIPQNFIVKNILLHIILMSGVILHTDELAFLDCDPFYGIIKSEDSGVDQLSWR